MRLAAIGTLMLIAVSPGRSDDRAPATDTPTEPATVVARVDRTDILQRDVAVQLILRQIPRERAAPAIPAIIEELIDRQLVRAFLRQQHIEVPPELLDAQLARLQSLAHEQQLDLDALLADWGYTPEALRADQAVPLGWTLYARKTITPDQVQQRFDARRNRFDGSQRRVQHLVIALPASADEHARRAALERVTQAAAEIAAGQLSFTAAVRQHSTSPTSVADGELGWTAYRGDLPAPVAEAAFASPLGKVAGPVSSPFGVHLVLPVEERPGDLSLEDARPQIMEELAGELWIEEVARLRARAKISRP